MTRVALLRLPATVLLHALVSMDTGLDTRLVDTGPLVRLRVFPSRETVFPSVRIRVLTLVLTSTVNHAGAHLDTCRFAAYLSAYFTHYCNATGQQGAQFVHPGGVTFRYPLAGRVSERGISPYPAPATGLLCPVCSSRC